MKKIYYFFALLVLGLAEGVKAQDIHFSQILETPLFLSPANTGFFNGYFRATVNARNQWSSMGNPYNTGAVSLDGGLFKSKRRKAFMGLGFTFFQDVAGAAKISNTNALLHISGVVKLSKRSIFSAAICGGVDATNGNYNKLTFGSQFDGNQIDPGRSTGETAVYRQFTTTDIGAGLAYEWSKVKSDQDHDDVTSFRVTAGAYHLNQPNQEFAVGTDYRLPVRWVGTANARLDLQDTKFSLVPAFVAQKQYQAWEYVAGSYIKYRTKASTKTTGLKAENAMGAGLFYRSNDAFIFALLFEMNDYAIGLSYDMNVSNYRTASKYVGGFEISLRYNRLVSSLFEARNEYK
jgi:type IX secretion system PorP/SprF family membrane protein